MDKCTIRVSKCSETYIEFFSLHQDYDAFLAPMEPSNPWVSDATELWEMFEKCSREQVRCKKESLRRSAVSQPFTFILGGDY